MLSITAESTGPRGRGRPCGTGYLRYDALLVEEVRAMIHPVATVPTLRDAVLVVVHRAHHADAAQPLSVVRRIERYCRAAFST